MPIKNNIKFFVISSVVIIAISFLVYFNTLNAFFTASDFAMLWGGVSGKFSDLLRLATPSRQSVTIRPLIEISWFFSYKLLGLNYILYRLIHIALYTINSILVLFLTFYLTRDRAVALGVGILFAIHPIHSGVVSFISQRYDLMCSLFYLLSLVSFALYVYKQRHWFFYILSMFSYVLAILSKEMAITLPLVIILYDSFLTRRLSTGSFIVRLRRYIPYMAITVIYIIWVVTFTGNVGGEVNPLTGRSVFFDFGLLDLRKAIYFIPLEFLLPLNRALFSNSSISGITITLFLCLVIPIVLSFKEILKNIHLVLFGFLWIMITLIPVHNFVHESNILAEARLVYLPSVGFCITLAFIILTDKTKRIKRYLLLSIFTILCIIYIFVTNKNNSIWIESGEISREIPRIAKDYYKRYGNEIKCFFWIPNITKGGADLFGNELPFVLAPLFKPLSPESVVLLGDNHATDPAYISEDFDLRQPEILVGLGKKRFFFRYNEDRAEFEDLSLLIRANLIKHLGSSLDLQMPRLKLATLTTESTYISQPLSIPAHLIGGVELKMRVRYRGYQDIPGDWHKGCTVCWYRDDADSLCSAILVELDGEFHTYRIPFTIYKPDWTESIFITKIELSPPSALSEVDIEYIKLFPYQRRRYAK